MADDRRRIAPLIVLAVAAVVAGLFVILAGSDTTRSEQINSFLIDRPAPRALGTTLDDRPFDLSRRKGSWVVLNFFDPSCVPCVQEHPELVVFAAEQATIADGAELYTIINAGSDDDVREFFEREGGGWPVVRDPSGAISVAFGVSQVPETWVIDPEGIVRVRYAGQITASAVAVKLQQLREQRI